MNLDTLNNAELYAEIAELARAEGVTSQQDWNELVDEVMESHQALGEENDDQDLEGARQSLHMKWAEYQRESAPESADAISEDPDAPNA